MRVKTAKRARMILSANGARWKDAFDLCRIESDTTKPEIIRRAARRVHDFLLTGK